MTIHRSTLSKLAFSGFLLALPLNAAFAQDTTAVADRLKAMLANQGVDLAWSGISGDASSMVMEGVTVKPAAEKDALPIGNVTLEGVSEADGGYAVATVSTQAFSHSEDGVAVDISPFVMHDLTIPAEGSTDPLAGILMYKSAELANMTVKVGDKTAFTMDNFSVEITPPADGKAMEFTGEAEKFTGDLTLVEDPKSKDVIDALADTDLDQVPAGHYAGYQTLKIADEAITVRITYQEGWALVLYVAADGGNTWSISSLDIDAGSD